MRFYLIREDTKHGSLVCFFCHILRQPVLKPIVNEISKIAETFNNQKYVLSLEGVDYYQSVKLLDKNSHPFWNSYSLLIGLTNHRI